MPWSEIVLLLNVRFIFSVLGRTRTLSGELKRFYVNSLCEGSVRSLNQEISAMVMLWTGMVWYRLLMKMKWVSDAMAFPLNS